MMNVMPAAAAQAYQAYAQEPVSRAGVQAMHSVQPSADSYHGTAPAGSAAMTPAENPFAGSFPDQAEVFSRYLEDVKAFTEQSAERRADTESLLKEITSALDQIGPGSRKAFSESAPTNSAAELALVSATEALHQYADTHLEEADKTGFEELIRQFGEHNAHVVASHRNIYDLRDARAAESPAAGYGPNGADPSERAMTKIGNVEHTEEEREDVKRDYTAIFSAARKSGEDLLTVFRKLQNVYLRYASGGSLDMAVRDVLTKRADGTFNQMLSYWTRLLA